MVEARKDSLIILGTVGNRKDTSGVDLSANQGLTVSRRKIGVTDEELIMGDLTYDLYVNEFHRPQPWALDVPNGVVMDTGVTRKAIKMAVAAHPDDRKFEAPATMRFLRLDALRDEGLSPTLVQNIVSSWMVEKGLSDFSKAGQTIYGRSRGQSLAYHQWSREESYHGELAEEIVKRVKGGWSEKDLDIARKQLLTTEWVNPFSTGRRNTVYAAFQEPMTAVVYTAMANQAREGTEKEGKAPTVSELIKVISQDESFHTAWFKDSTELYATLDREGTEQDVYFVARRFRMPGDYFFLNPGATIRAYRKGLGYSEQSFARRLYEFMNRFTFVDKNKTLLVAAEYGGTLEGIGKIELDEMLQWSKEKLAQSFKTDDRLKVAEYRTKNEILTTRKSKLVL